MGDYRVKIVGGEHQGIYDNYASLPKSLVLNERPENPYVRAELQNRPSIDDYHGPMFDGFDRNGKGFFFIRYETSKVYESMSN